MSPTRGHTRLLRVAVLGGSSLLLATTAHRLGGGTLPGPGVLAVTAFLLGLVAVTVTARRCRFGVLLGLLGLEQGLLHVTFSVASLPTSCPPGMSEAHHVMAGALASCWPGAGPAAVSMASGAMASGAMASGAMGSGWTMWAAHAAAVLATAWLLSRGEAWCWRVTEQIVTAATTAPRVRVRAPRLLIAVAPALPAPRLAYAPAAPRGPPLSRFVTRPV